MNNRAKVIFFLLLFLPLAGILLHYLYLHSALSEAYEGHPDPLMRFLTTTLYPRFEVEKNRFELSFFISKADQVLYRSVLVYYLLLFVRYRSSIHKSISSTFDNLFYTLTSSESIHVLRWIFFTYLLYLSTELCHDLIVMQPMKAFYKPILWLRIAHIPFPGYDTVFIMGAFWYLLNILILLRIRITLCAALSLFLFLLMQCWVSSFEKMDHGYVTFTYVFILIPFLFDEQKRNLPVFRSWSLQLIRISLAMVYFLSGLEKLFISSFSWLDPENMKTYLYLHKTYLSEIIIQYDFLCILISILTLLFQLSFILIVFIPRYKWIWIGGGILFHTGTLLVMGIGHPLNPWLLVYVFFFDWTKVYSFFAGGLRNLKRSSS